MPAQGYLQGQAEDGKETLLGALEILKAQYNSGHSNQPMTFGKGWMK